MMHYFDPTPIDEYFKKHKARFRWRWEPSFKEGGYWAPLNYAAETFFLIDIYGEAKDNLRRFKE